MPVLDQHRDNPAFVQSLRRKPSKRRVVSNSVSIQKPTEHTAPKPSLNIRPTNDAPPDAAVAEVTDSMAAMLSQDSHPIERAEDVLLRQQRAPTADMTTALSQQRRDEIAEGEERARAQRPAPVILTNIQQHNGPFHDDISSGDESTESETLHGESFGGGGTAVIKSESIHSAGQGRKAEDVRSPEVEMSGTDRDTQENLFVSANLNRPSQQRESRAATPIASRPSQHQVQVEQPAAPKTLTQFYAADAERVDARRDEQDPDFRPDPAITSSIPVVGGAQEVVERPSRQQRQPSPPKKRHSSEIRRETPKKPKAGQQADQEGKTPTTIKGKRFTLLKDATRQERCNLMSKCKKLWGKSIAEVVDRSIWPRSRDKHSAPLEPRDWPTTLLGTMSQLADFTTKRPEVAAQAIRQAIDERRSWYSHEAWLVFLEDAQGAVKLAMSGRVILPAEQSSRVDSPRSEDVVQRLEPRVPAVDAEMSSGQDDSDDQMVGSDTAEGDLYGRTPRPQTLPVSAFQPQLLAAIEAPQPAKTFDAIDLTMEDADDQDIKRPAAYFDAMRTATRSVDQTGTMSLFMIMGIRSSGDLSSFENEEMVEIHSAAYEWNRKARSELSGKGPAVEELANKSTDYLFSVKNRTADVQVWIQEEIKSRKRRQ